LGTSLYEFVSTIAYALFIPHVSLPDPANASDLAQVVRATKSELSDDLRKLVALPV